MEHSLMQESNWINKKEMHVCLFCVVVQCKCISCCGLLNVENCRLMQNGETIAELANKPITRTSFQLKLPLLY